MTKEQVKAVLNRVATWPEDRQQELAELALEIEAELAEVPYRAARDALKAMTKASAATLRAANEVLPGFQLAAPENRERLAARIIPVPGLVPGTHVFRYRPSGL